MPRLSVLFQHDCQTIDTNSAYFARWCFSLGIQLRRIEAIADEEEEIIEAVQRMSKNYDLVVTSGGIGPTSVHQRAWPGCR
jgi:molybdopterin-biosynthesis enzyme MoeA-like protein